MGTWGTAIFSDDTADDVRWEFTELVASGLTAEDATKRLTAESADILEDDDDEALVFWLALAATQWKLGRLLDSVRQRALEIIDSGIELSRWQESGKSEINQRKKHLAKLREQLLSPQPKARKLKPHPKSNTDFQPGDIAVYRLDEKTAVRFCAYHLWGDRGGTYTDLCLLGLDDGRPFRKSKLRVEDTCLATFTMLSHEPADRIKLLRRNVSLPSEVAIACEHNVRIGEGRGVPGGSMKWDEFPDALRKLLPELGWLS